MNIPVIWGGLLVLVLAFTCGPAPVRRAAPLGPAALHAQQRLAEIGKAIDDYRLSKALADARVLRPWVERRSDSIPDTLRARLYQYLAILHYHRNVFLDSITYYSGLADSLVPEDAPVELRARQALCWAYVSYHGWANTEMDMYSAFGRRLLEEAHRSSTTLYANLLHAQGIARKKYGDQLTAEEDQIAAWLESEALLREALQLLRTVNPGARPFLFEDLSILLSRLPSRAEEIAPLIDSITVTSRPGLSDLINTARARGYYHVNVTHDGAAATREYRRLLREGPYFTDTYPAEAYSYLHLLHLAEPDYTAALAMTKAALSHYGCCTADALTDRSLFDGSECLVLEGCVFELARYAAVLLDRYQARESSEDLIEAYHLCETIIGNYRAALERATEEGVFNQVVTYGDWSIAVALSTALAASQSTISPIQDDAFNLILRTMEVGKSHSLTAEYIQARRVASNEWLAEHARKLTPIRSKLDRLKRSYAARILPPTDLIAFDQLTRSRRLLASQMITLPLQSPAIELTTPTLPTIVGIQEELSNDEALIEYIDSEDATYALYIDRDTSVAYRVDTSHRSLARAFQSSLVYPGTDHDQALRQGNELYRFLLSPVHQLLAQRSQLNISPSASLTALPFAALCSGSTSEGKFLIAEHTLRTIDNWQTRTAAQRPLEASHSTSLPSVGTWVHPDLSGYFKETNEYILAAFGPASTTYAHNECNTQSLLQHAGEYDILHLSVHARGDVNRLDENYLYLSTTDSLDGVSISRLSLPAHLVVLAACSSARGVVVRREDNHSLQRSFRRAGVPYVISSLYDIPALATARLLAEFYRQVRAGVSYEEALALAQRAFRERPEYQRFRHPFYWAGLTIS